MFQNEQREECINKGWEPLVYMIGPVLPHKVKSRWGYFTFSRTQLPVLCVHVKGTICRDNDLECRGRAHDLWLGFRVGVSNTRPARAFHAARDAFREFSNV